MKKAKFESDAFEKIADDSVNGEHYRRHSDNAEVLVWYDYQTRLWVVYAIDENEYQVSREADYVMKADVVNSISFVDAGTDSRRINY